MVSNLQVILPTGSNPFSHNATSPKRSLFRAFNRLVKTLIATGAIALRNSTGPIHGAGRAGTLPATAVVTCAAVAAADTITLNGTALTATQLNATATATCASVSVADTLTLGGVVFTAAATEDTTIGQFAQITSDTATAVSLAACINAAANGTGTGRITNALYGLVDASNAAGVVTIRARTGGTAGNAITLVSSTGVRLAVTGSGFLANGAVVANNQFDYTGTNAQTAAEIARAIAASTTALVGSALLATNRKGTFTLVSMAAGDTVTIGTVTFTAVTSGGDGTDIWGNPARFSISGTDTADATALKNAINAHPHLKDRVIATSSAGVVTVRPIPDLAYSVASSDSLYAMSQTGGHVTVAAMASSADVHVGAIETGISGNMATIATSNGARLAIAGAASRLTGGTSISYTF